jgi:hypothetical protein
LQQQFAVSAPAERGIQCEGVRAWLEVVEHFLAKHGLMVMDQFRWAVRCGLQRICPTSTVAAEGGEPPLVLRVSRDS